MAHYAVLDSSLTVTQVFVGRDDVVVGVDDWETYYAPEGFTVKQTSYNTYGGVHYTTDDNGNRVASADQAKALRFNYAGIGFTYDATRDAFISPPDYPSWILDETTCLWEAPVALPDDADTVEYVWDEASGNWVTPDSGE